MIEVLGRDAGLNKSYEKYFEGKFTRDEFNEAYNRLEQNIKDYVELGIIRNPDMEPLPIVLESLVRSR